jgi:hypothetical protein
MTGEEHFEPLIATIVPHERKYAIIKMCSEDQESHKSWACY